jgi:hypothetical protein
VAKNHIFLLEVSQLFDFARFAEMYKNEEFAEGKFIEADYRD